MSDLLSPPVVFYLVSMTAVFFVGKAYGADRERTKK